LLKKKRQREQQLENKADNRGVSKMEGVKPHKKVINEKRRDMGKDTRKAIKAKIQETRPGLSEKESFRTEKKKETT